MPTLKALIEDASAERPPGSDLVVTGPHYEWLERLEEEQMPSAKAMAHVVRALLRDFKHERSGRFSPSSMGECARRIVFGYAGAPQLPPDVDNQEMMDHGTISHLKWQIEGLTMGYMQEAEVWVHDPDLMVGGSLDGVLHDGSVFEEKTSSMFVYNKIVLDQKQPKWEHLLQVHTYFLLTGADWASVVYEDRSYRAVPRVPDRAASPRSSGRSSAGSTPTGATSRTTPCPRSWRCASRGSARPTGRARTARSATSRHVSEAQALPRGTDLGRSVPLGEALPVWARELIEHVKSMEASA